MSRHPAPPYLSLVTLESSWISGPSLSLSLPAPPSHKWLTITSYLRVKVTGGGWPVPPSDFKITQLHMTTPDTPRRRIPGILKGGVVVFMTWGFSVSFAREQVVGPRGHQPVSKLACFPLTFLLSTNKYQPGRHVGIKALVGFLSN